MDDAAGVSPSLHLAGVYRREVKASLRRVWENVFDWEHLPALHSDYFHAVELLHRGPEGWKVRLVNQPGDPDRVQVLELRADRAAGDYVATTLEGLGAGSQVRTRLRERAAHRTAVVVEFHVPEADPQRLSRIGEGYLTAYAQLWDEDEAMMVARERTLARRRAPRPAAPRPKALGPIATLRDRLPLTVTFGGEPFRLIEVDGEIVVHAATCPHWLGPLDAGPVIDGCVRCPWHGYSFDVRTGASADGRGLLLPPPPRLSVRGGLATLTR